MYNAIEIVKTLVQKSQNALQLYEGECSDSDGSMSTRVWKLISLSVQTGEELGERWILFIVELNILINVERKKIIF